MKNGPSEMSLAHGDVVGPWINGQERALSQWSDHRTYRTYVYVRTYPTVSTHPRRSMTSAIESTCRVLIGIYM